MLKEDLQMVAIEHRISQRLERERKQTSIGGGEVLINAENVTPEVRRAPLTLGHRMNNSLCEPTSVVRRHDRERLSPGMRHEKFRHALVLMVRHLDERLARGHRRE